MLTLQVLLLPAPTLPLSRYGLPTSSSQCIVGAIVGVGLAEGIMGVNWKFFAKQAASWLGTLFAVGLVTAAIFAQVGYGDTWRPLPFVAWRSSSGCNRCYGHMHIAVAMTWAAAAAVDKQTACMVDLLDLCIIKLQAARPP
jgi:hypothetical protein